jgi:hypothetical protein
MRYTPRFLSEAAFATQQIEKTFTTYFLIGMMIITAITAATIVSMSKPQIDEWFTNNYSWMDGIAKSHIYINKRDIEPAELLSNAYLYAQKKRSEIDSEKTLEIYMSRYIMTQSSWTNSETNKQTIGSSNEPEHFDIMEDDDDLESKIEFEKWFMNCKATLAQYRATIKENHKRVFFDEYFAFAHRGEKPSVRKVAKKFSISNTSAHNMIVEMRESIQRYIAANSF